MQSLRFKVYKFEQLRIANLRYINKFTCNCSTWTGILKQAELTVGYSTSFLNLRWLLSDEIANLASSVSKILGTNHPILKTAKNVLIRSDVPSWGLIILLISKASGNNLSCIDGKHGTSGILHTQRMVAEIVETLKTGIYFHKSLQLKKELERFSVATHQGNKIALLVGDFLITKSYQILAEINNSEVEEIISSALRDLCEEEFFGERDDADDPIPSSKYFPDDTLLDVDVCRFQPYQHKLYLCKPKAEWAMRNCLGGAFLLGKGCYASVKLGEASETLQDASFTFGVNLALACQARTDLNSMQEESTTPIEKVSAPLLFHLQQDTTLDWKSLDDQTFRTDVQNGVGLRKTEEMLNDFLTRADISLMRFPQSDARDTLQKMLTVI